MRQFLSCRALATTLRDFVVYAGMQRLLQRGPWRRRWCGWSAGITVEKSFEESEPGEVTEALIRGEVYPASAQQARHAPQLRMRRGDALPRRDAMLCRVRCNAPRPRRAGAGS